MIIAHFVYSKCTLIACSMTCHSWYIAAIPYLHYSLTMEEASYYPWNRTEYMWPTPLRKSYDLGLLPLVKQLRIRAGIYSNTEFTPEWLGRRTLRYFTALTNLQELGIDNLQLSRFMPNIQQCFGHLSPTLRFLALRKPTGSCRQILYFIGLFPNLQDLKFESSPPTDGQESTADAALVPLSVPPLRGRLILARFAREGLVRDMITFFGGLRFRSMDLFEVECVRLLLYECRKTLETLRLYPTDPYGEEFVRMGEEDTLK